MHAEDTCTQTDTHTTPTMVHLVRLAGEEGLVTEGAGEGTHPAVCGRVTFQQAAEVEPFAALLARVGHTLGVHGAVVDVTCRTQITTRIIININDNNSTRGNLYSAFCHSKHFTT